MRYEDESKKFNISEYLLQTCNLKKGKGDNVSIYSKQRNYTYSEVERKVNQYAHFLVSLQIDIEQRIGILLPDMPEYIFIMLGAMKAGLVVVPINCKMRLEDIIYIIQDSRMKYLFSEKDMCLQLCQEDFSYLRDMIPVDDTLLHKIDGFESAFDAVNTFDDDIALWIYTSGSSGRPKGVMHRHHDMLVSSEFYGRQILNIEENDIIYSHSKLSFAFGLGNSLYLPFAAGASVILNDDEDLFSIPEILKKFKPTLFFGVPVVYKWLLKMVSVLEVDFDGVKFCVSAGEALPKEICMAWFDVFGCEILQGLGSTEMLHIALSNHLDGNKPGSAGTPIPGYSVKLLDENDHIITEPGTVGELYVAGGSIMTGYWHNHAESTQVLSLGGLKTGDMFYKDEDDYYWYVGRNSDMFKMNGKWVSASQIEGAILNSPFIKDVVVSGEFTQDETTIIVAYLVGDAVDKELIHDIKRGIRINLGREFCPQKFHIVDYIPKGSTGKIFRSKIGEAAIIKTFY